MSKHYKQGGTYAGTLYNWPVDRQHCRQTETKLGSLRAIFEKRHDPVSYEESLIDYSVTFDDAYVTWFWKVHAKLRAFACELNI